MHFESRYLLSVDTHSSDFGTQEFTQPKSGSVRALKTKLQPLGKAIKFAFFEVSKSSILSECTTAELGKGEQQVPQAAKG